MNINRREFLHLLGAAGVAGLLPACSGSVALPGGDANFYDLPSEGDVRLLHITDTHAQLLPVYFREPSVNLGFHDALGRPPHLTGNHFLQYFDLPSESRTAHAFTALNFAETAERYGKVGGFAYLKTLIDQLRGNFGLEKTLLLDGGDTWQGSGTALWTRGKDMVGACNLLGVDVMTGHWEFTYRDQEVLENIGEFKGEFLAQNIRVKEDALFDGAPAYDEDSGHAFKPYTVKILGGRRVAIIGQAFPYTPVANPARFIPDWTFGINDTDMQELVDQVRANESPDAVVVLSHNGMDVDLKMASRVNGIDAILGGHTHDGVPQPVEVKNSGGITLVTNAGSNGKFVGVLDLNFGQQGISSYSYRLLPVFANMLKADKSMSAYIDSVRAPYQEQLAEPLAVAGELLYRRGNFNGTFDQIICDALRKVNDAQISLSPGFRWGTSVLPGQTITMEHVLDQTCMTYPETYVRNMSGRDIKAILEDVGDNLFNPDPYYQQGGDMVRVGGLNYRFDPLANMGQRVSAMSLDSGEIVEATKSYRVAGWATVGSQAPGEPIWDTVATYLKDIKIASIKKINSPELARGRDNPGFSD